MTVAPANLLKKKDSGKGVSCEFWKPFFTEHLRETAFVYRTPKDTTA